MGKHISKFKFSALTLSPGCPASITNSPLSFSWWDLHFLLCQLGRFSPFLFFPVNVGSKTVWSFSSWEINLFYRIEASLIPGQFIFSFSLCCFFTSKGRPVAFSSVASSMLATTPSSAASRSNIFCQDPHQVFPTQAGNSDGWPIPGSVMNTYCYIMSTFTLPNNFKHIIHPGVGPRQNDDDPVRTIL